MNDYVNNSTTAWGDESVRIVGNPPFYLLGVCLLESGDDVDLSGLVGLLPSGSKKLHWRDMSQRLQCESLRVISNLKPIVLVAAAAPIANKRQERARRKCLEALLPELELRGVARLVLESRGPASDIRDLELAKYAKGSHSISSINIAHAAGADEPRLWIADQVIGAMGDYMTHAGNWNYWKAEWEALSTLVETIGVPL